VHVRTSGFVEHVAVGQSGVTVKRGQNLFSMYSPELFQAQSELLALRGFSQAAPREDASGPGVSTETTAVLGAGTNRAVEAARLKLELLGMSKPTIDQVLSSGKPARSLGVSAPLAGVVTRKDVVLGSFVTPERVLYEITDLSKLYVVADLFQREASHVQVGTEGTFVPTNRPELRVTGKVDLVYPEVKPETRTTRVRMQIDNRELGLLPGQYGVLELASAAAHVLVVPRDALIDTGKETYVFVQTGPGRFAPRIVEVVSRAGNEVSVSSGVFQGELVVSGAAFLIDSESRLRASLMTPAPAPTHRH
jgi:Cu(I)/Ag(I) efflux system membrane fusion protein